MEEGRTRKKRAVRLTLEARERLLLSVQDAWRKSEPDKKLTRDRRAEIVGLSVGTSERLFRGEGVDRPSVLVAFSRVGLELREEDLMRPAQDPTPAGESAKESPEEAKAPQRPSSRWALVTVCVGIFITIAFLAFPQSAQEPWIDRHHLLEDKGTKAYHNARYDEATTYLEEALDIARTAGDIGTVASTLRVLGEVAAAQGDLDTAYTRIHDSLRFRKALLHSGLEANLYYTLGELDTRRGRFPEAEANLRTSLALARKYEDRMGVALAYRGLGNLALRSGRGSARTYLEAALIAAPPGDVTDFEADVSALLAMDQAASGDVNKARRMLKACLDHWSKKEHKRWMANVHLKLAQVEGKAGNPQASLRHATTSEKLYESVGDQLGLREARAQVPKSAARPLQTRR